MVFDKNQTEFKDCVQEKVWELAIRQVPLDECWNKTKRREVFGKKIISCGTNIRILDPDENDLKYIYRLLDLRTLVIKESIDDPYYPGCG